MLKDQFYQLKTCIFSIWEQVVVLTAMYVFASNRSDCIPTPKLKQVLQNRKRKL